VLYAVSVPREAARVREGVEFVAHVLSAHGARVLRDANLDLLQVPVAVGTGVPREISDLVRTSTPAAAR
jgi:hypothetical protein